MPEGARTFMARGTISRSGRIQLPRSLRARLNLQPGMQVSIDAADGTLRIRPLRGGGGQRRAAGGHAEDRVDRRIARRRLTDPERVLVPWDDVKRGLDL